ncbi:unnamed protein product [Psylliodes chrysocephalus]|uniref:Uncharacterized protein n=1 Tax=Psylliodes chrysocephalus TaxID=3402493 RepID=A0A9P0CY55_9CUCU|nr:unnamed protein product [Psylliodes chrysocephala]
MGIHNPYDDDADESVIENQKTNEVTLEYVNAVDVLENKASTSQTIEEVQSIDSEVVTEPWKKYTPIQLQPPVSAPLVPSENKVTPVTVIKPMTSSNIAKKYVLLLDKRLQIVDTQLSHIKVENKLKIKK